MTAGTMPARVPSISGQHAPVGENAGRTIRILRMGRSTRERLDTAPREVGEIHSAYARTLNLLWHDGRLLALHGPGYLRAPFAAAVSHLPGELSPGTRVRREEKGIRLGSYLLAWEGCAAVDTRLRPEGGDAPLLLEALASRPAPPAAAGLFSPGGRTAQRRLDHGIRDRDAKAFVEGATALIGLGEGLTPAGDDCLVGALAVLSRHAMTWLSEHAEIRTALAVASETGTTTVGREFLLHALEGSFSEAILGLMQARSAAEAVESIDRLRRMGASSGADTLWGMRLALEALFP
jgi:hypothetical protein